MLSSVHLVGDEDDDIYGGFNDYNPAFDTEVRKSILKLLLQIWITKSILAINFWSLKARYLTYWHTSTQMTPHIP